MYRVYLRSPSGVVSPQTKTSTENREDAVRAFEKLVNRTDLDGTACAAAITFNHNQIAYHRFERQPGQPDNWRNRMGELPLHVVYGHTSNCTGRSQFVTVRLDVNSILHATEIGGGDLSTGIKLALRQYREPPLEILANNEIMMKGRKTGISVRLRGDRTVAYRPETDTQKYEELPLPRQRYALSNHEPHPDAASVDQFVADLRQLTEIK